MDDTMNYGREKVLQSGSFGLWKDFIKLQRQAINAKLTNNVTEEERLVRKINLLKTHLPR